MIRNGRHAVASSGGAGVTDDHRGDRVALDGLDLDFEAVDHHALARFRQPPERVKTILAPTVSLPPPPGAATAGPA